MNLSGTNSIRPPVLYCFILLIVVISITGVYGEGSGAGETCSVSVSDEGEATMTATVIDDEQFQIFLSGVGTSRTQRSKNVRRPGKKTKKKIQDTISFLTGPNWCIRTPTPKLTSPTKESLKKDCWLSWCTRYCDDPWKLMSGSFNKKCIYPPYKSQYCPENNIESIYCKSCTCGNQIGIPGFVPMVAPRIGPMDFPSSAPAVKLAEDLEDLDDDVSSSTETTIPETAQDVGIMYSEQYCRPPDTCCGDMRCYEDCSHFYGEIFPVSCHVIQIGCARSRDVCNEKVRDFLIIWAEFVLNFLPGAKAADLVIDLGRATTKAARKRALKRFARRTARSIRREFRRQLNKLKRELKQAIKDDIKEEIDEAVRDLMAEFIIDDILEEMTLQTPQQDEKNRFDEYKEMIEEAAEDFLWSLAPFDLKAYQEIMKGPLCSEVRNYDLNNLRFEWDIPEVENVAYAKPTKQSSTYESPQSVKGLSSYAVDGTLSGDFSSEEVTHTNQEMSPWWEVDLLGEYLIDAIIVYNREDCCISRLNGFQVEILNKNGSRVWSKTYNGNPSHETRIEVGGMKAGNKVRVSIPAKKQKQILSLAEVEVLGKKR